MVNAAYAPGAISHPPSINVAIAVAMPDGGLITPTLQKADETDIYSLSRAWADLVKRARAKALKPDECAHALPPPPCVLLSPCAPAACARPAAVAARGGQLSPPPRPAASRLRSPAPLRPPPPTSRPRLSISNTHTTRSHAQQPRTTNKSHTTALRYSSGTFTISNLGMMGVDSFGAILPPGTGAILAIGASKPAVVQLPSGTEQHQQQRRPSAYRAASPPLPLSLQLHASHPSHTHIHLALLTNPNPPTLPLSLPLPLPLIHP